MDDEQGKKILDFLARRLGCISYGTHLFSKNSSKAWLSFNLKDGRYSDVVISSSNGTNDNLRLYILQRNWSANDIVDDMLKRLGKGCMFSVWTESHNGWRYVLEKSMTYEQLAIMADLES